MFRSAEASTCRCRCHCMLRADSTMCIVVADTEPHSAEADSVQPYNSTIKVRGDDTNVGSVLVMVGRLQFTLRLSGRHFAHISSAQAFE